MGGQSHRCETKLKQFTLGIGTLFCPKLGEDQKKKEKKGLCLCWDRVLRPNSLQVQGQSSHILIANDNGWAVFAFRAKISLRSIRNRVFCILCMPMWVEPPLPPLPLATLLLLAVRIGILPFNSSSIALVSCFIDLRKKNG